MFELDFTYRFETAHRFTKGNSKCATPHGHTWQASLEFAASPSDLQSNDMIEDFANLKAAWRKFLTGTVDHSMMHHYQDPLAPVMRELVTGFRGLPFPGDPTTELVAALFLLKAQAMTKSLPVHPVAVTVQETPTNRLRFRAEGIPEFLKVSRLRELYQGWWDSENPDSREFREVASI